MLLLGVRLGDEAELQRGGDIDEHEAALMFVAASRARDRLVILGSGRGGITLRESVG